MENNKSTTFVKLTAKPKTWFKEGTEVFHYDSDYEEKRRLTIEDWTEWFKHGMVLVRGVKICDSKDELNMGYKMGEEREDGECCNPDEFEVEIIEPNLCRNC